MQQNEYNYLALNVYRFTGRPPITVDMDDVEFLRSLHFSWTKIAEYLNVSRTTLYRRLEENEISIPRFSSITDLELDACIRDIKRRHPNDGERMIIGHLFCLDIFVPRYRIRSSIHRVDGNNVALRRSVTIRRRVYYADGPNTVWHLDGHHRLIRWRIVTHGVIDGYSRSIVYLRCSNNNRATTVLHAFCQAVDNFGLPNRVRTDNGGENVDVWRYMIENHSTETAVITGSSVHNERIERLWRDVFRCVVSSYHHIFREMESNEMLDPLNETDLFCLHQVYIPRINCALSEFSESWNNHSLSSERNMTPNQLFLQGTILQGPQEPTLPQSSLNVPVPAEEVEVPNIKFIPCESLKTLLDGTSAPTSADIAGISTFQTVTSLVGHHLSSGCPNCYSL